MTRVLLNLGCGLVAPESWQNYDASLHQYISSFPLLDRALQLTGFIGQSKWPHNVRYLNLNKPWPFTDNSVDVVYSHHVFEHLSQKSADLYLRESRRVLRRAGVLRIVVPDLKQHAQEYLDHFSHANIEAAAKFLSTMNLQPPRFANPLRGVFEWASGYPSLHKTMYDEPSLRLMLESHHFASVTTEARGQSSRIAEIREVEPGEYGCSLYLEALPEQSSG